MRERVSGWIPLAVFIFGIAVTTGIWHVARLAEAAIAHAAFERRVDELVHDIESRLAANEQALRSGVAFMYGTGFVDREMWHDFVTILQVDRNYQGVEGVGYAVVVRPDELEIHEAGVRAEGFPDYRLWPAGERELYSAVVFLEPGSPANLKFLGFDMLSESTRRAAMERARDIGAPALSGKVVLHEETASNVSVGSLLYLPVYRRGMPVDTVSRRREALMGYVYSPLGMQALFDAVRGRAAKDLAMEVFDATYVSEDARLYRSHADLPAGPLFDELSSLTIAGRDWTLRVASLPAFERAQLSNRPSLVALCGLLVSLLGAALVAAILRTRSRALALADEWSAAHRESEARVRTVMDNTADGILTLDAVRCVLSANRAAEDLLGLESADLVGRPLEEIWPWAGELLDEAERTKGMRDGELRLLRDGGEVVLRVAISFVESASARIAVLLLSDVTARVASEQALRQQRDLLGEQVREQMVALLKAKDDAERANQTKSEFLANMSHELRTPLHAILSFSKLSAERNETASAEKRLGYAERINQSARRLLGLINDLLDLSKLEAGKMQMAPVPCALPSLWEQCLTELEALIYGKRLRVSLTAADGLGPVCADPGRIVQVFHNLMSNAIKFSPEGGAITIRLVPESLVTARGAEVPAVRIEVADEGVGIPEAELEAVFDKFIQSSKTHSGAGGTGLGLAICREIVEAHGGWIRAHQGAPAGTVMVIVLPVNVPEPQVASSPEM
ncbi:CHASE domain-containing protein [Niveibacterium sp. 24ML]|uniref:CHASE domain-containing sensor histidine kinase n=1 Tax=Niveibacterium sp. 24ML TaxID=2985512 RepID=UPI002270908A|nr:CHASE domain-containing protein [Niveibacterium sp. 24ML]MCX9158303.1 CHASE domain-containing protein [Niveibacterium sp. 24ML]